jgi:hypothetical protein
MGRHWLTTAQPVFEGRAALEAVRRERQDGGEQGTTLSRGPPWPTTSAVAVSACVMDGMWVVGAPRMPPVPQGAGERGVDGAACLMWRCAASRQ